MLHSAFCIFYFAFCIWNFAFCNLQFEFCISYFEFCISYFEFCISYFAYRSKDILQAISSTVAAWLPRPALRMFFGLYSTNLSSSLKSRSPNLVAYFFYRDLFVTSEFQLQMAEYRLLSDEHGIQLVDNFRTKTFPFRRTHSWKLLFV